MDAPAGNGLLRRCSFPALIAVATVAAFLPALQGEFLNWDDDRNFLANPSYRGLGLSNLRWMWTTFLMGHYHPITWMTLGADFVIWGMNPFGYHLTSLLIHSANSVLLFLVIEALLRLAGRPRARIPALLGALLHALHPLRVESVAWITERRDVCCGFFFLLSLLAWLKHVEAERQGNSSPRWLLLSLAAFACSLLSKALGIMLPAVLLLLDVYPLNRFVPGLKVRLLREKAFYGVLSLLDALLMLFAMRSIHAVRSVATYNIVERAAQAAYGLCFYVVKTLSPINLIPIYRIDIPMRLGDAKYVLAMVAAAAGTAALVVFRRRVPGALVSWLSMVALLLPVLGIAVTGFQIAADRYTYLALMPAAALAAWALDHLAPADSPFRRPLFGVSAALLAVLGALTWTQCGFWRNSRTLWDHTVAVDPENFLAYLNRGTSKIDADDPAGALEDYNRSLELRPTHDKTWNSRGIARERLGDLAGARSDYDQALQLNPDYPLALTNRGSLRQKTGDLAGAFADSAEAIRLNPEGATAYVLRASLLRGRGDLRGAEADLDHAVALSPQSVEALNNRGTLRLQTARYPDAVADYSRALALKPDNVLILVGRGQARLLCGDAAGAAQDFERALRQSPPGWGMRKDVEAMLQRARGLR
jgi:tetratricopeptide (TPR) repeat protein